MAIRNITPAMQAHLQGTQLSVVMCARITPAPDKLKPEEFYTEHDQDITFEGNVYKSDIGLTVSTISTSIDFNSDNTEIRLPLSPNDDIPTVQYKYLDADVELFLVNWKDLTMGKVLMFKGFVSSVEAEKSVTTHEIRLTINGILARQVNKRLPRYSRTCRTDLGSPECGVPVLPAYIPDIYRNYPREYIIGYQGYDMPAGTLVTIPFAGWTQEIGVWTLTDPVLTYSNSNTLDGVISNTINVSFAETDIFVVETNNNLADTGFGIGITQLDSSGTIIQQINRKFDKGLAHNLSVMILANTTQIKISLTAKSGQTTTFQSVSARVFSLSALDKTIHTLKRVTDKAHQNRLLIPNGYFYKDGNLSNSCDTGRLTDWTATCTGFFGITNNQITGQGFTIEQVLDLPTMGCDLLASGCYYMDVVVPNTGGTLTTTIELLDENNVVLQTETTTTTNRHRFQVINNQNIDKYRIKLDFDNTAPVTVTNGVEVYLINSVVSAAVDPTSVTLNNSGEIGTKFDIWQTQTTPVFFETTVLTPDTNSPRILFTVDKTNLTSGDLYGEALFISGQNSGVRVPVRNYNETAGLIELITPVPTNTVSGDKLILVKLCDKSILTCGKVFNNNVNFRGEPYLPGDSLFN